ncbi:hypothetical protein V493_01032, partial [Pseudogymnoascus sp. VKM F-4281 (FW-2241)]
PAPVYPSPAQDDCGGIGGYSIAPDYMKLLTALLHADAKLLKSSSIDEMFEPQLPDSKYLEQVLKVPEMRNILVGNFPEGLKVNFGLGGMLNMEPLPSGRRKGSMQWGGMPNLFWWIDRKSAICGTYFSQVMPMGDRKSIDLFSELETERVSCGPVILSGDVGPGCPIQPTLSPTVSLDAAYIATSYVDSSLEGRHSVVERYDGSLFSSSRLIAETDRSIFRKSICETYDRGNPPSHIGTGRAAQVSWDEPPILPPLVRTSLGTSTVHVSAKPQQATGLPRSLANKVNAIKRCVGAGVAETRRNTMFNCCESRYLSPVTTTDEFALNTRHKADDDIPLRSAALKLR